MTTSRVGWAGHRHRPVYERGFTNAVCEDCGFFPLPLQGARYVPKLLSPSERAAPSTVREGPR